MVPDALLEFHHATVDGRIKRTLILLKHDLNAEQEAVIRRTVQAYAAIIKAEQYKTWFTADTIMVAFTTFGGEDRCDQLRAWAAAALGSEDAALVARFI